MQPGDTLLPQLTVHAQSWFDSQPIGRLARQLWQQGYAFDYASDDQLKKATVVAGKIQVPGGAYQVIVVPDGKYIPLETFRQLLKLADSGAQVIFESHLPADFSGAAESEGRRHEFKALRSQFPFGDGGSEPRQERAVTQGNGSVASGDVLHWLPLSVVPEPMVLSDLSFVRRSFPGGWNYFIANRSNASFDHWLRLARSAKSVVILDPMTGASGVAARHQDGQIYLQLAPGQSVMLRAFAGQNVAGPAWNYWHTNGRPAEITGPWNVSFIAGGPRLPADFRPARLASWATFPGPDLAAFSGTAKYETSFDAPKDAGTRFELDLGEVCQSARVRLNGQDYGTLITPPFRVIVDHLKPAGNTLEVEVTSVDANRIRDLDRRRVKWKVFRDINLVNMDYKPFNAANWPLTDCGLLGPVTLTPVSAGR
jgi:hypothetical protein